MFDGKVAQVITDRQEIEILAGTSKFDALQEPQDLFPQAQPIPFPFYPHYASLPISGD
jgi:hypothetical protein